jgi:hypothetical protein
VKHNLKQKEFLEKQLALSKGQRELNQRVYRERNLNTALKNAIKRTIQNDSN